MKYLIVLLIAIGATAFIPDAMDEYMVGKAQLNNETHCVNLLIAQGVERIDIATSNGTCWQEANGYYK